MTSILAFLFVISLSLFSNEINAQNTSFSGEVSGIHGEINEPLPGATIYIPSLERGTSTDSKGKFNLENLPRDTLYIEIRYMGYERISETIDLRDGPLNSTFALKPVWFEQDEVFITARPTLSPVAYQTVQNISRQELQQKPSVSLGEMLDGEPGLNMRSMGSAPARPVIRGFDGERVLILENGERMGDVQETAHDHAVSIDPAAIDEIEVIRGPASLLYGANAIGGVVNMFTSHAPRNWETGWEGTAGIQGASENNMLRGSGSVQKGWENLALKGSITLQNAENTTTPEGELYNSHGSMISASTGIGYRTLTFQGNTSISWNRFNYGIPEYQAVEHPDNTGGFFEEVSDIDIIMDRIGLTSQNRWTRNGFFEAVEFRINAGTMHQQEREWEDDDYDLELDIRKHSLSSTLTLRHGRVAFIDRGAVGINLNGYHTEIGGDEAFHPGVQEFAPAAFIFEEIDLTGSLAWQSGLRTGYRFMETLPNELFPEFEKRSNTFNIAASTGLNYKIGSNIETGIQIARAYRNPTVSELYASGWHAGAGRLEVGNEALETEKSYGLDAFTRLEYGNISGEVTGFYNHIDDYIVLLEGQAGCPGEDLRADGGGEFAPCFYFDQVNAVMYGFETYWKWQFLKNLNLTVKADVVYGVQTDAEDKHLPFIPPARISPGLEYQQDSWEAKLEVRSAFPQKRTAANELSTPGYIVPQLHAGYKFSSHTNQRIVLRIENPFDQTYYNHLSRVRRYTDSQQGPESPSRFPQAGRNISLGYYVNF